MLKKFGGRSGKKWEEPNEIFFGPKTNISLLNHLSLNILQLINTSLPHFHTIKILQISVVISPNFLPQFTTNFHPKNNQRNWSKKRPLPTRN